jgi:hypothetical protein
MKESFVRDMFSPKKWAESHIIMTQTNDHLGYKYEICTVYCILYYAKVY